LLPKHLQKRLRLLEGLLRLLLKIAGGLRRHVSHCKQCGLQLHVQAPIQARGHQVIDLSLQEVEFVRSYPLEGDADLFEKDLAERKGNAGCEKGQRDKNTNRAKVFSDFIFHDHAPFYPSL
jgi:hypothetical protein